MKTSSTSAANASSRISSIGRAYRRAALLSLAALLAACSTAPTPRPAPVETSGPGVPASPPTLPAPTSLVRGPARWVPAAWSDLPGWDGDRTREAWSAFVRGCERLPADSAAAWSRACADAQRHPPADDAAARSWFMRWTQPWRVVAVDSGSGEGLATGYFEPLVEASRVPRGTQRVPLHQPPADLATRKPWFTRAQIDTLPAAQAALRGREIAYVADPLDLLLLQVQGSGRLRLTERDGRVQTVRVAYAGHNDQPYQSIGRWLIDQGALRPGEASWPAIRDWAARNPRRVTELLHANPRVVFFREEPLPDAGIGPRGAQGVPLTPERSIAVDPKSVPYGTPVWLDTTEPLTATPLRRLVLAQDTGSAIVGAVRADYFWGWGERAEQQAGRMKQALRVWVLWPK